MPFVRQGRRVVAIVVSDLHLCQPAPAARADIDWHKAMARPLRELCNLQNDHACPVLCCGDIFDRWNAPAELINFALRELPYMSAIPGQHDLPHHRYADVKRSAYWTLVEAGKVYNLEPGVGFPASDDIVVWGYPWGHDELLGEGRNPKEPDFGGFNVAIIHSYIWTKKCSYPGAPSGKHLSKWRERLKGFRVACLGDNHRGFLSTSDDQVIFNVGAMMRRKTDEHEYRPCCGLIYSDGTVERRYFDTSEDVLLTREKAIENAADKNGGLDEFLDSMRSLGHGTVDFVEVVHELMAKREVSQGVRESILKAMEKK